METQLCPNNVISHRPDLNDGVYNINDLDHQIIPKQDSKCLDRTLEKPNPFFSFFDFSMVVTLVDSKFSYFVFKFFTLVNFFSCLIKIFYFFIFFRLGKNIKILM